MEASVKAAKVLAPPQAEVAAPSLDSDGLGHAAAAVPSGTLDPMDEFRQRLEDIISGYSSATNSLLEKQRMVEAEMEKKMEETQEDTAVTMETELAAIMQTLNRLSSPEDKLKTLVHKYTEMAALRRGDEKKLTSLQQAFNLLLDERKLLHLEQHHSVTARGQLECLCRDLQSQYDVLREEAIQHCRDDEEKRNEMTDHFQNMLKEIQDQIELHNSRNQKLCHENTSLTTKLESLMNQCEMREESLEKINKHRDLQHKLTEAKLQQATAQLAEAEEKHKREKEYLLVQAAEWKLQAQTFREQGTVMQAQLTLYSQKFDEFQETLSKSNEIYVRFKKEMDNMSEKMKKMDKESNLWKTRFENCNKALTDMIEERNERSKEYEVFVLKIQRLEKLCRALQDERKVLYDKIRDVRRTNANIPSRLEGLYESDDIPNKPPALTEEEFQELEELQKEDPVLTQDMARLKEEQAKLQEFAAALLASPEDEDDDKKESLDVEEDSVASAFAKFSTKLQDKEVSEQEEKSESETHQEVKAVKTVSFSETLTTIEIPPEPKPEPEKEEPQVDIKEDKPVETEKPKPEVEKAETQPKDKPEPEQNPVVTPEPENIIPSQSTGPKPQTAEAIPVVPVEEEKTEPEQKPEEEGPESENTARTADEPAKKQTPKKKKKRTGRV